MGVGAMVVGGLWSMWSMRAGMRKGVRQAILGLRGQDSKTTVRTDRDLATSHLLATLVVTCGATVVLYQAITGSFAVALTSAILMVVASFFFVAVSSYIVGLVGSSNNPISGMTVCALIFASIVLLLLGMTGATGILAALGVAGVVCCAAATAGDTSQDLKTGFLVKATPWRQQVAQIVGVLGPSLVIAPVLTLLHAGYGIGTGGAEALRAPQATLFASIAQALFNHTGLPWTMVGIGVLIGIGLIVLDGALERRGSPFRAHVMPVAVGIYLPLSLASTMLVGGLLIYFLSRAAARTSQAAAEAANSRAVLLASGLIAGEAVAGILIAIPRTLPQTQGFELPIPLFDSSWLTMAGLAGVVVAIYASCWAAVKKSPR
jgi:putative OPT family oligopeptide transporter